MTMIKPILLSTSSFDATLQKSFSFSVQSGGSQVVANQLTIRNQSDNTIVYQAIQNSFKYEHILPENTLRNGEYYNAVLITFDAQGNQSPSSAPIQFKCFTTPNIVFSNIPEGNIINNTSFEFKFKYEQEQKEPLNSYVVNLYNVSDVIVSSSKTIYVQDGKPPYVSSYLFSGFEDNTAYYVEIVGETINNTIVKTGKIKINVSYIKPSLFSYVGLKNNCEDGNISVTSNIILIDGNYYPVPPTYINNKEIDVRDDRSYVGWDKGYAINGDYLVRAWFRSPTPFSTIIQFSNISGQIVKINFMYGYKNAYADKEQAYVEIYITSCDGMDYYIFSNYIDILNENEYYNLQLKKEGPLYEVKLLKA